MGHDKWHKWYRLGEEGTLGRRVSKKISKNQWKIINLGQCIIMEKSLKLKIIKHFSISMEFGWASRGEKI